MAIEPSNPDQTEALACITGMLCTRTLHHFAEEAQQDGESLRDAFERYEIDYAWFVLGSERLRDATLSSLIRRYHYEATEAQKVWMTGVLKSAAQAQPSELLMSFDNDVADQLADFLSTSWVGAAAA